MACAKQFRRSALLTLYLLLAACGGEPSSPEQRVRSLIDSVQQAVEAGSVRQVKDFLHERYSDRIHASRAAAIRTLFGVIQRHRSIHLFTLIKTVDLTVQQDAAEAVVYVAMTGAPVESMEALISTNVDLYRFEIGLVDEDGEWQILRSRWERVDPGAL